MINGNNECPQYRINLASPFRFDIEGAECSSNRLVPSGLHISAQPRSEEIECCDSLNIDSEGTS